MLTSSFEFVSSSKILHEEVEAYKTPVHPDYATYRARLCTFRGLSENLNQTPEILASAGFYYGGSGDHVICFHCDGGLREWKVTDDVWTEHARWFPKCYFVNFIRGHEFIEQCVNTRPPLDESIFETRSVFPTIISSSMVEVEGTTLERFQTNKSPLELNATLNDTVEDQTGKSNNSSSREQSSDTEKNEKKVYRTMNKTSNVDKITNIDLKETALLQEENMQLKEARLCKVCMDLEVAVVFLPCSHLVTCIDCAPTLKCCPMCRQHVQSTVRAFLS